MKHILVILVFALTSSLHASVLTGIVTRVIDGDTVVVQVDDGSTCNVQRLTTRVVRLAEIDAPESDQDYGPEATAALQEMVLSNRVVVTWTKKDRYRRVIGTLTVPHPLNLRSLVPAKLRNGDGSAVDVNEELVRSGHAWQYTKYSKSKTLGVAQTTAQEQQLGLWKANNPTAPWEFRRK